MVEESLEAFKATTSSEINGLRMEVTSAVQALAQTGPGVQAVEVINAHSGAQLESRLQMMEQQLQSLKASTRSSSPSKAMERKAEVTEQKLSQLEAKFREQRNQWTSHEEQIQKMKDSLMGESASSLSRQLQQLQAQVEEVRDRSTEGIRVGASNLSSLEAGIETWRQRVDKVLMESEQRLNQEVERRLQVSQERLAADLKSMMSTAEAENLRKKMEQSFAQEMRQFSSQVSKLESDFAQNHESVGSNVSGLLQRLTVAEMSIAEEQSKMEILRRQLEARMEMLGEAHATMARKGAEASREGANAEVTSPRSREFTRMVAQVEANDKETKRLLKDMQGMEKALERVSEGQRKMVQEQANDLTRQESSRLEDRKGSEKSERRMKARLDELEARLELIERDTQPARGIRSSVFTSGFMILKPINVMHVDPAADGTTQQIWMFVPRFHAWEITLLMPIITITGLALTGGRSLLKKTLPFGTAVSICLFLRAVGDFMQPPWNRFQASTAIVTVVLLMEPGITLERLLLKFLQRLAGTCCGSILAVIMALCLEVVGKELIKISSFFLALNTSSLLDLVLTWDLSRRSQEPLQIGCFCFTVFTMSGTFQVLRSSLSLMFSAMCISCAAVMFGFMLSGWVLIHAQVKASKEILDRTRTAIDLVFTKHQATCLSGSTSRAQQFRRGGRSRTLSGSLLDLLTRPARLGALEDDEAALAGRCRSCLSDMASLSMFTNCIQESWFFTASAEKQVTYDLLPQQIHGLFLQACALAHVTPLKAEVWRRAGASFQKVRVSLSVALESLKFILECLNIFGSAGDNRFDPLERLCGALEDARSELQHAWKASKTQDGGNSLHSAAALCQGFDSLVVQMASFALFYLQRLKVETKEGELQERLSQLMSQFKQTLPPHSIFRSPQGMNLTELSLKMEEQRRMFQEQDSRQRQVEETMKEAQPMLKMLQEHDARLAKSTEASQQLQRQQLELKSEFESQKDMLEVRCLERLELQGKRLEDVAKRMEHLEDSNKNLGLQMANPTEQVATSEN
eukprot:symbB.v1.2.003749.t3/scaffold191.1/size276526/14